MQPKLIDLKRVGDSLQEECPFITFATITGIDEEGRLNPLENVELSVFLDLNTGLFFALEKILPVMTVLLPEAFCEVTLLNRVDVTTRYQASNSRCLFIRSGGEQIYRQFVQRSRLDYRILRARCRMNGMINYD